jgi:prevent-host-death family protein
MSAGQSSRGRVLIVADDPSILHSYSHGLTKAGFSVAEASSGKEALRQIKTGQFEVLISDVKMPVMNGLALLRRMHEHSVELHVILMLEAQNNQIAVQAAELGALQCLVKPIRPELLEKTAALAVRLNRERRNTPSVFHTHRSEQSKLASFTATEAKNEFGRILEKAIRGSVVVITKHDAPKAVLMSMDEFNALSRAPESKINVLTTEFDSLLARMQGSVARNSMKAAFHASPRQLGEAAVAAVARKRG